MCMYTYGVCVFELPNFHRFVRITRVYVIFRDIMYVCMYLGVRI